LVQDLPGYKIDERGGRARRGKEEGTTRSEIRVKRTYRRGAYASGAAAELDAVVWTGNPLARARQ